MNVLYSPVIKLTSMTLPADISNLIIAYSIEPIYWFPDWVNKKYHNELLKHMGWNPRASKHLIKLIKSNKFSSISSDIFSNPDIKITQRLISYPNQINYYDMLINPSMNADFITWAGSKLDTYLAHSSISTIVAGRKPGHDQFIHNINPELCQIIGKHFDNLNGSYGPIDTAIIEFIVRSNNPILLNKYINMRHKVVISQYAFDIILQMNPSSIPMINTYPELIHLPILTNPAPQIIKILEHLILGHEYHNEPDMSNIFTKISRMYTPIPSSDFMSRVYSNPGARHIIMKLQPKLKVSDILWEYRSSNWVFLYSNGFIDHETNISSGPESDNIWKNLLMKNANDIDHKDLINIYGKSNRQNGKYYLDELTELASRNKWMMYKDKYKFRLAVQVSKHLDL